MSEPDDLRIQSWANALAAGDRAALGRAITLVESIHPRHRLQAHQLLRAVQRPTQDAYRIGISGPPGAGKSTLIEALGQRWIAAGHRIAVLAVDPSSSRSGGSILGDKTRMTTLARDPSAFVRPSPSAGTLGGVARRTRETMTLCEAAGYDLVVVETVGVGQSESTVAEMVDAFLLLVSAGAGDDLQGIKRGNLELADVVAVTKADGPQQELAERSRHQYAHAMSLAPPREDGWVPPVLVCSAHSGFGLDGLVQALSGYRDARIRAGYWNAVRQEQRVTAMWRSLEGHVIDRLHADEAVQRRFDELREALEAGEVSPEEAASSVLGAFLDPRA